MTQAVPTTDKEKLVRKIREKGNEIVADLEKIESVNLPQIIKHAKHDIGFRRLEREQSMIENRIKEIHRTKSDLGIPDLEEEEEDLDARLYELSMAKEKLGSLDYSWEGRGGSELYKAIRKRNFARQKIWDVVDIMCKADQRITTLKSPNVIKSTVEKAMSVLDDPKWLINNPSEE